MHLERMLPVPPDAVFRMFSTPALLATWWGPRGFSVEDVELDVRAGGAYRIVMQPPDGEPFSVSGQFREVQPPGRLAYTFNWDPPDPEDQETVVTLTFGEREGGTELTLDQGPFATERRRALHVEGWTETLDRLEEQLP